MTFIFELPEHADMPTTPVLSPKFQFVRQLCISQQFYILFFYNFNITNNDFSTNISLF